jgi:hypothetical protein
VVVVRQQTSEFSEKRLALSGIEAHTGLGS